jgi:hypothetical protein
MCFNCRCCIQNFTNKRTRAHQLFMLSLPQVVLKAEAAGGLPRLGDLLVEDSWRQLLGPQLASPGFADLEACVRSEWGGSQMVFPPKDCVFRWVGGWVACWYV